MKKILWELTQNFSLPWYAGVPNGHSPLSPVGEGLGGETLHAKLS
jgi:hypothetical protein